MYYMNDVNTVDCIMYTNICHVIHKYNSGKLTHGKCGSRAIDSTGMKARV